MTPRAREGVTRTTIGKELATFRFIANWAAKRGIVPGLPDWKVADLTLPKGDEKPPFQTWTQIVAQVANPKLTATERAELWESLWLNQTETREFLNWARDHRKYPWMYPLLAIAAYTGARRSEVLRSEPADWDFDGGRVMIRQKKSDRSKTFTRRYVTIHPDLAIIIRDWIGIRPPGNFLICSPYARPIRPVKASESFRLAVKGTKWEVLRGYHVLRHSLASNLASRGVDQRIIDDILGHSTAEMSRRYRHLSPDQKESAIRSMFSQ